MLSDREQRALHEVEEHTAAEDPAFAHTLQRRQQSMPDAAGWHRSDRIVFSLAAVLGFAGLWSGSFGAAVTPVVGILLCWAMWRSTGLDNAHRDEPLE